ncbi:MAG: DEAD/DEAH box helicase family protein [Solobacterium sp.]|nr:DEAD/DEAH box helicase family protein [Solobacterium sp.]
MQCKRCLNEDEEYFYLGKRGYYCRKCISFGREMVEEEKEEVRLEEVKEDCEEYVLKYPLTLEQEKIAFACVEKSKEKDVLIHAVCGAGKTEIVLEVISRHLKEKKKVCFAIPRRQVVLELQKRLHKYFHKARVISVCAGHTEILDGDLIICTTHQLYRYYHAFDLLILDEPDAFPFKGSEVLHGIAQTSCKERIIYLTATPDAQMKKRIKEGNLHELKLNKRPHGKDVPVPKVYILPFLFRILYILYWINKDKDKPKMIFMPTILEAKYMAFFLGIFIPCFMVSSKSENKDAIIQAFRKRNSGVLVTTTIMERGVTIANVDVLVDKADHSVFDEASLIQMAGRVGRTFAYPYGEVIFLCQKKSEKVISAKHSIEEANLCVV